MYLCIEARKRGWRAVVLNSLGGTPSPLQSPRFLCTTTDDVKLFVDHVHQRYPVAPLIGIGMAPFSILGLSLTRERDNLRIRERVAHVCASIDTGFSQGAHNWVRYLELVLERLLKPACHIIINNN